MNDNVRVALIDSHPIVREGLRALLIPEHGLELIAEGSDIADAYAAIDNHGAQVILIDLHPLGARGPAVIRRLREERPKAATVVFTITDNEASLVEALVAGARGYLLKESTGEEITAAVKAAARGRTVQVPRDMLLRVLRALPWVQQPPDGPGRNRARLTRRELEILEYMATGVPYRELADQLCLAESTIKKYAHSVIGKLGASCRATAVITAYRLNLLETPDEEPEKIPSLSR
ncbi:MAG: response regulator [Vulcanimicrobiota bacterium]